MHSKFSIFTRNVLHLNKSHKNKIKFLYEIEKCYKCEISLSDIKKSILLKAEILTNIFKYNSIYLLDVCYQIIQFLHKEFYSFTYPVLFVSSDEHSKVEMSYYKPKTHLLCPSCYKFGILKIVFYLWRVSFGHNQGYNICKKMKSF